MAGPNKKERQLIVGDLTELKISTVLNPGEPNKECVAINVLEDVNMGQFGLMLGNYTENRRAVPYFDNMFWFGDGYVKSGDWIFVFTGSGTLSQAKAINGTNDVYYVYWGKPSTVFAESTVVPMIFRVDAVDVAEPPRNLLQIDST